VTSASLGNITAKLNTPNGAIVRPQATEMPEEKNAEAGVTQMGSAGGQNDATILPPKSTDFSQGSNYLTRSQTIFIAYKMGRNRFCR